MYKRFTAKGQCPILQDMNILDKPVISKRQVSSLSSLPPPTHTHTLTQTQNTTVCRLITNLSLAQIKEADKMWYEKSVGKYEAVLVGREVGNF